MPLLWPRLLTAPCRYCDHVLSLLYAATVTTSSHCPMPLLWPRPLTTVTTWRRISRHAERGALRCCQLQMRVGHMNGMHCFIDSTSTLVKIKSVSLYNCRTIYIPQHPILKHPQSVFFFKYKRKFPVLCILNNLFFKANGKTEWSRVYRNINVLLIYHEFNFWIVKVAPKYLNFQNNLLLSCGVWIFLLLPALFQLQ